LLFLLWNKTSHPPVRPKIGTADLRDYDAENIAIL